MPFEKEKPNVKCASQSAACLLASLQPTALPAVRCTALLPYVRLAICSLLCNKPGTTSASYHSIRRQLISARHAADIAWLAIFCVSSVCFYLDEKHTHIRMDTTQHWNAHTHSHFQTQTYSQKHCHPEKCYSTVYVEGPEKSP